MPTIADEIADALALSVQATIDLRSAQDVRPLTRRLLLGDAATCLRQAAAHTGRARQLSRAAHVRAARAAASKASTAAARASSAGAHAPKKR